MSQNGSGNNNGSFFAGGNFDQNSCTNEGLLGNNCMGLHQGSAGNNRKFFSSQNQGSGFFSHNLQNQNQNQLFGSFPNQTSLNWNNNWNNKNCPCSGTQYKESEKIIEHKLKLQQEQQYEEYISK